MRGVLIIPALLACLVDANCRVEGGEWSIPLAGNTYRYGDEDTGIRFDRDGYLLLQNPDDSFAVFFHSNLAGKFSLSIQGYAVENSPAVVEATANAGQKDEQKLTAKIVNSAPKLHSLGKVKFDQSGYHRITLRLGKGEGSIKLQDLILSADDQKIVVQYVKDNQNNMFYWGRRGPSIHLAYQTPPALKLTHAYAEVMIAEGKDKIGTYAMANGFGEGYFGIQVNSESERRVLFSVWSPFKTDDPSKIPDSDRIKVLAKGKNVRAQDFGNEGSGGQSFLVFPWEAGVTYRFLTEVQPDGEGNTKYTSWFADKRTDEWLLIASFLRPKTDTYLTRFHSFLENFNPSTGHLEREAVYKNQWVLDSENRWHEITRARFTGDATAGGRYRLDFAGGAKDDYFFLRHCGFFNERVGLNQVFQRNGVPGNRPQISLESLPRQ